jgi:hypothetical protein
MRRLNNIMWGVAFAVSLAAAYGGQSLVLTNSAPISTAPLSGNSVYSSVNNWRIEGQFDNLLTPSAFAGLWELDSAFSIKILISPTNDLILRGYNNNEGTSLSLGSSTSVRFVAQRNSVSGKYTLEAWNMETGAYTYAEGNIQTTGSADFRSARFSIGSFYEAQNPNVHLGHLRWYSSVRATNGPPPPLSTTTYGNLLDYEFEGNLNDSGPQHTSFSLAGGPTYASTVSYPPGVLLSNPPISQRAGESMSLNGTASFSNSDSPAIACTWQLIAGTGIWNNQDQCLTTLTPPVAGTYIVRLRVADSQGRSQTKEFTVGAVATDENGGVILPNATISSLLGPMVRYGTNPWGWADNRHKAVADHQVSHLDTFFPDYWNTASPNGTVAVVSGSTEVTGTGTQFQTDFCGGAGSTTPVAATRGIYIWYASPDYPGQYGRGRYLVQSCESQEHLTLTWAFSHKNGSSSGLSFRVVNPDTDEFPWVFSGIPANYYDNVLALYKLYYLTGQETYRNAARALAQRFWTGPNWDMGASYNTNQLGGRYITAGPARGQAVTGLIVWALESNTNIWPGVHHLWDYWMAVAQLQIGWGQMGDIREMGYITSGLSLCAHYDPDPTYRANCGAAVNNLIDNLWGPLEVDGHWRATAITRFFAGSGVSVHVVDGSPQITLNGSATWSESDFSHDHSFDRWAWFINDPNNVGLAGKQNSDVGDTVAYRVLGLTDATHAVLTSNYNSGACPAPDGCNKGMALTVQPGFGTSPFMLGLAMGGMGTYVYDYYASIGDTVHANRVKRFVADGVNWLSSTGFDMSNTALYQGRDFLSCEPNPGASQYCWATGARSLAGEAMLAFSADYMLNQSSLTFDTMERLYQGIFAKPGYSAPYTLDGTYLVDIDDPGVPGAYMLSNSAQSNKWLGFFFGYGGATAWPLARIGGVDRTPARTITVPLNLSSVPGSTQARLTVTAPTGTSVQTLCSESPCTISVDDRQGNHQLRIDYLSSTGELLAPGETSLLTVRPSPSRRR